MRQVSHYMIGEDSQNGLESISWVDLGLVILVGSAQVSVSRPGFAGETADRQAKVPVNHEKDIIR